MILLEASNTNLIGVIKMNSKHFSHNLRRLRLAKSLTQEQLADTLGVSTQSVSRWECGNTLPDVMLLPEIARLYGVTVDDLYREESKAYANYAQRLVSVYEATGRSEDFLAAEQEFLRMPQNTLTADDLRSWGVLYHYMVQYCVSLAHRKLADAMEHHTVSEDIWCSAALQRLALMNDTGKGSEVAELYDTLLTENPTNYRYYLLCATAHHSIENNERAFDIACDGISHFPDRAILHCCAGDIAKTLKQYDAAFKYWRKTLEIDPDMHAAAYSIGFCYEELGQFDKAYRVWCDLTGELDRRGLTIERKDTAELAEKCRKRMG